MKFSKFLLDDYMMTKEGKEVCSFFENFKTIFLKNNNEIVQFTNTLLDIPHADKFFSFSKKYVRTNIKWDKIRNLDDFIAAASLPDNHDKSDAHDDLSFLPFDSLLFFLKAPDFAFPYLFPHHYYKISEIFDIFEIPIPPLPARNHYVERYNFYFSLCRALYDFRQWFSLSPCELCVFLYGFAPRFIQKTIKEELSDANRIYIVGANAEDVKSFELLKTGDEALSVWQGNIDMLPGDIVLMYETAPYSRLGSIWRAVSHGYDDPFAYYPGKVFLNHPIKIPYISFSELALDPIWGKKGLVVAHMQGVNGRLCTPQEYEQIIHIAKEKNRTMNMSFDLSRLPKLAKYSQAYHAELENERDIEQKLLEPFLHRLGYSEKEWKRQIPIRMGRGIRYYPDYAIHVAKDNESADFIWEAKYRIPSRKLLQDAFIQAKSYALRLACKGFGLVSQEGIWLSSASDHFDFSKLDFSSWDDLTEADRYANIKSVILKQCAPSKH